MARIPRELVIDLDSLTPAEIADARAIAAAGGVDAAAADLADPPVPLLAGLIYVTLRRASPKVTPRRCVRLAVEYARARDGA